MKKIFNIVGARPQFVKYFPISKSIESSNGDLRDVLVHTGQHYDYNMSKVFFDEIGIKRPDYNLGVGSGSHSKQTAQIMEGLENLFLEEKPDVVIVYGDTNSTLAGAIAASKIHIPVVHVEAGLRSYNKNMPEEINRLLTDHVATLNLCPSKRAVKNLESEGLGNIMLDGALLPLDHFDKDEKKSFSIDINHPLVINVGDVMYDVLLLSVKMAEMKSRVLKRLAIDPKSYFLLTVHRAENTDNHKNLIEVINFTHEICEGKTVIFPMHPRTRKACEAAGIKFAENIKTIGPAGYFDILMLTKNAELLLTDSGGMQKEAFWLNTPCVTLRNETEWSETIESGWNVLKRDYRGRHHLSDSGIPYGDGDSASRIISALENLL